MMQCMLGIDISYPAVEDSQAVSGLLKNALSVRHVSGNTASIAFPDIRTVIIFLFAFRLFLFTLNNMQANNAITSFYKGQVGNDFRSDLLSTTQVTGMNSYVVEVDGLDIETPVMKLLKGLNDKYPGLHVLKTERNALVRFRKIRRVSRPFYYCIKF
jgi:hypothetical protein